MKYTPEELAVRLNTYAEGGGWSQRNNWQALGNEIESPPTNDFRKWRYMGIEDAAGVIFGWDVQVLIERLVEELDDTAYDAHALAESHRERFSACTDPDCLRRKTLVREIEQGAK